MKNNVQPHRKSKGITQAQLAERVGVSRQSIVAIETGKYVPSTLLALKIARELDAGIPALFELEPGD